MDIKKSIKKEVQDYFLSRIKYSSTNKSNDFSFSDVRKIALLFLIHGKEDLDIARKILKKANNKGFEVSLIAFSDTGRTPDIITDRNTYIFTRDDFNYKWAPHGELKDYLGKSGFDLIINFCLDGRAEIVNLYTLVNAKFRIANQDDSHFKYNDLTIKIKNEQTDWASFYNLALRNLEMLNIKK